VESQQRTVFSVQHSNLFSLPASHIHQPFNHHKELFMFCSMEMISSEAEILCLSHTPPKENGIAFRENSLRKHELDSNKICTESDLQKLILVLGLGAALCAFRFAAELLLQSVAQKLLHLFNLMRKNLAM